MNFNTEIRLLKLERDLNAALDKVFVDTMAKLRTLTRVTGQRTRVDRVVKKMDMFRSLVDESPQCASSYGLCE